MSSDAVDPTTIGDESGRVALQRRREARTDHVHKIPFDERAEVTCPDCGEAIVVGIYGETERSYGSCWTWDCDAFHKFERDRDTETATETESAGTTQTKLVTDGGCVQDVDEGQHAFLGDCSECGERMVEVLRTAGDGSRTVQLECEDEACNTVGRLRHDFDENPFNDPLVCEGVENVRSGIVSWHDCPRCRGHGWVEDPIDDLQRAMNGREHPCPRCHTTGSVIGEVSDVA